MPAGIAARAKANALAVANRASLDRNFVIDLSFHCCRRRRLSGARTVHRHRKGPLPVGVIARRSESQMRRGVTGSGRANETVEQQPTSRSFRSIRRSPLAAFPGQNRGISGAQAEDGDNRAIWVHGSSQFEAGNGWCAMSVFQYGAEAYRLLLTLVGLIIGTLFGPLRFMTIAMLLLCIGGVVWFISVWLRRRNRTQEN